jgi:hypothetical protein
MDKDKIVLEFSVDEINVILKALGNMPFNQVYEIIGNIHQQANHQLFNLESPDSNNDA